MHPSSAPEITIESIGKFLVDRGWRKITDLCFSDTSGVFGGVVHWSVALEAQMERDHKAAVSAMANALGTAAAGATR